MSSDGIPSAQRRLFWDIDPEELSLCRDADYVIARILEHGRMDDVRWLLARFGRDRIHSFLRDRGSPELSDRTLGFWRAALHAESERWPERPSFRIRPAPWNG
jgi:hypothetical protein